jgi:ABC-type glutathione transport system ATPase component
LLEVRGLVKHFPVREGRASGAAAAWCAPSTAWASTVREGETLGVVGESGCGKSTHGAAAACACSSPTAGELVFDGATVRRRTRPARRRTRRQVQMVFQDSYASLNPRLTIEDSASPSRLHGARPAARAGGGSVRASCSRAWGWSRSATPSATRTSSPAGSASA